MKPRPHLTLIAHACAVAVAALVATTALPAAAQKRVLRLSLADAIPAARPHLRDDDSADPTKTAGLDSESAVSIATLGTGAGLGSLLGVAVSAAPVECGQQRCLSVTDALFLGPGAGAGFASLFAPVLSAFAGDGATSSDAVRVAFVGVLVGDGVAGLLAQLGGDADHDVTRLFGAVLASLTPVLGYELARVLHNPTVSPSVSASRNTLTVGISGAF